MSHTSFRVNPHSIVCWNFKKLLAWSRRRIWSLSNSNGIWTHNHLVRKLNTQPFSQTGQMIELCYEYLSIWCIWLYVIICHVRVSEWIHTLKFAWMSRKLLAWSRRHIWRLSDSNGIRTHNHLVCKRKLHHLTKPAKWLSCVVSTYLYSAFDCMFLSCHVRVLEWIHTL